MNISINARNQARDIPAEGVTRRNAGTEQYKMNHWFPAVASWWCSTVHVISPMHVPDRDRFCMLSAYLGLRIR